MRRAGAIVFLLTLALAAPAEAQSLTYIDFENLTGERNPTIAGATFTGGGCPTEVAQSGGNLAPKHIFTDCFPRSIDIGLPQAQAVVDVYGIATDPAGPAARGGPTPDLRLTAYDAGGVAIKVVDSFDTANVWTPLVAATDDGSARITRATVQTFHGSLGLDDVGFSPVPQPDTEILSGPSGTSESGDATFTFGGNQGHMTFRCVLDGGPASACSSPLTFSNLADGGHTFTVTGVDAWRIADKSPAARNWTIARRPPPPKLDRDADGVLDTADNCPDAANPGQGDADGDAIGDACELLPSGTNPVEAGRAAQVTLVSGEVFVKLPAGASVSAFTARLRAPFQDSGFLPLKGVATVPMGSTIDTRAGEIAVTAAINGQRATSKRQLRRRARFKAGIFAIRQARFLKGLRKRKIPPRAELTSAPGTETPCRGSSGPAKGTRVRSLVSTAKGVFRTVGGAATTAPAKGTATYSTTDRCDGTVTSVGRGRVAVIAKKSGKRTVVRAGRSFIVRARLFSARKGRG